VAEDWLIVGLGNPGSEYENTRHNVGFLMVDKLAKLKNASWRRPMLRPWLEARWYGKAATVWLLKPLTYMNKSGSAVSSFLRNSGIPTDHVLVVADQIDLPPGRLRLKTSGSAGGHRGLLSIEQFLGQDYPRLWVGVGRPEDQTPISDWVLSSLGADREKLDLALGWAAELLSELPDIELGACVEKINGYKPA